jgi:TonB family protein
MRWSPLAYLALGIAAHLAIGVGIVAIPKSVSRKSSLVAVVEKKKKDDKKDDDKPAKADEPPPPPPKPIEAPRPVAKPKAPSENTPPPSAAPPSAAAHPALAALPSLGISMAGGPGGVGIAIPVGPVGGPEASAARPAAEGPRAAARNSDCTEDPVKPKLLGAIAQDRIVAAAQAAGGVEGKIRLEILVDEIGNPTSVRVTTGLGGAVDEAAVAAGKRAKFKPSTRCGKAAAGRFVVAFTVRNPD